MSKTSLKRLAVTCAMALAATSFALSPALAQPRQAPNSIDRGHNDGPGRNNGNGNGNRINIGNDVDIDIDTDPGWDHDHDHDHHPVAVGIAVGTAIAIGTRVYVLPTGCVTHYYANVAYSYCGTTWYRTYYQGTTVTYVVVQQPY